MAKNYRIIHLFPISFIEGKKCSGYFVNYWEKDKEGNWKGEPKEGFTTPHLQTVNHDMIIKTGYKQFEMKGIKLLHRGFGLHTFTKLENEQLINDLITT
jgi:hypothetical protein